jgi:hypothetical protein
LRYALQKTTLVFLSLIGLGCNFTQNKSNSTPSPLERVVCNLDVLNSSGSRSSSPSYKGSCTVTCSVNALAINFNGVEPRRACTSDLRSVDAALSQTIVKGKWLGTMQGVKPEDPQRFEVVATTSPERSTPSLVGRTPFGWFAVLSMKESANSLTIEMDADRQVRPTASDIAIIARAIELIPNESVWNKNDNRQCPEGQPKISMFCALQKATTEISGGVHYRQPALQAVREALNNVDSSRIKDHRIMDYNNHPATTLAEIHQVLRAAQSKLKSDLR